MSDFSQSLHLHIISMHTSPLAQPGSGDAGGMNVYIDRSLRAMLSNNPQLTVEVFTLVTSPARRRIEQVSERAVVHCVYLPQAVGASKADLPALVDDFAAEVQKLARKTPDVIHSHYWLSGLAALAYGKDTPIVHTMHTTAAAKDERAGAGESKEPAVRRAGEQRIVDSVSALVVNTDFERDQMVRFYGANLEQLQVIAPGVDTGIFAPCSTEPPRNRGSSTRAHLVFAGRPQPLKGPHILVEALSLLPDYLSVDLSLVGKSGTDYEQGLLRQARDLGVDHLVELLEPLPPRQLAQAFRQADIVTVPSSSETFGLVALEAQACGTPVLATKADGLLSAVDDGHTGILVEPRTPRAWATAIEKLVTEPVLRERLGQAARKRTLTMRWQDTATQLIDLYLQLINRER